MSPLTQAQIRAGYHECPDCGAIDTPSVLHCRGGRYAGCCQSFSSIAAFDIAHPHGLDGHYQHLDPVTRMGPRSGKRLLVSHPARLQPHRRVWSMAGSSGDYWESRRADRAAAQEVQDREEAGTVYHTEQDDTEERT